MAVRRRQAPTASLPDELTTFVPAAWADDPSDALAVHYLGLWRWIAARTAVVGADVEEADRRINGVHLASACRCPACSDVPDRGPVPDRHLRTLGGGTYDGRPDYGSRTNGRTRP